MCVRVCVCVCVCVCLCVCVCVCVVCVCVCVRASFFVFVFAFGGCVIAVARVYVGGIRIGIGMSSVELKASYTSSLRPHTLVA